MGVNDYEKRTLVTAAGTGSLPRDLEKSSGPSGLVSRETEACRMLPIPPLPEDCWQVSEVRWRDRGK